jgi:periplasmic protein TonB
MTADKAPPQSQTPPVSLAGASRVLLPPVRRGAASGVLALVLSCALHAAPVAVVGYGWMTSPPVSAGEEVIDLDFMIAEDDTQSAPPVEAEEVKPERPDAPSVDAAQAPEKPREDKQEPEAITEQRLPEHKPEPHLAPAEQKILSVANAAAPVAAREATQATLDARYSARVARHLARFKRFPAGVRGNRSSGRVVIRFALNGEGRVTELALVNPSGVPAFDAEALAMIQRAEPFPKSSGPGSAMQSFTIPVTYRLRD